MIEGVEAKEGSLLESEGPLDLLAERKLEGFTSNVMDKRNSATTTNVSLWTYG